MTVINDHLLAAFAQAAYGDEPGGLVGWEMATISDADTDSQAIVARSWDDVLIVAVRGSQSRQDWRRNLAFWPSRVTGFRGRVHRRWAESAEWLADILSGHIASARAVYWAGHSMGGSVADLAESITRINRRPSYVVTFGAPAAGDARHAEWASLADDYTRYVIGLDKVARLAVKGVLGYRHPVEATRLPSPCWWPAPISDHAVERYVAAMEGR